MNESLRKKAWCISNLSEAFVEPWGSTEKHILFHELTGSLWRVTLSVYIITLYIYNVCTYIWKKERTKDIFPTCQSLSSGLHEQTDLLPQTNWNDCNFGEWIYAYTYWSDALRACICARLTHACSDPLLWYESNIYVYIQTYGIQIKYKCTYIDICILTTRTPMLTSVIRIKHIYIHIHIYIYIYRHMGYKSNINVHI